MRHPDVFAAFYALSPCCLAPHSPSAPAGSAATALEAVTTMEDSRAASFETRATIASAAAWASNPHNLRFFLDLPYRNGVAQPLVQAKFSANAPLAMLDQYVGNLRELKGVGVDAGDEDRGIAGTVVDIHDALNQYGIPHLFEIYPGDHLSGVGERIRTQMLPFFSRVLGFG